MTAGQHFAALPLQRDGNIVNLNLKSTRRVRAAGAWLLCSASIWSASGCGGSAEKAPQLTPVAGKVTLNGEPLAGASVSFIPRDSTKGTGGFGATLADGSYEMMHRSQAKGVEAGTYVVWFSKFAMPDGSPIPEGKNATDVGAKESLPPELSNPPLDRALHVITVKSGEKNNFNFDLKSKKKAR